MEQGRSMLFGTNLDPVAHTTDMIRGGRSHVVCPGLFGSRPRTVWVAAGVILYSARATAQDGPHAPRRNLVGFRGGLPIRGHARRGKRDLPLRGASQERDGRA